MSKILGLTGGIACGKSTISAYLKEFGIPVIDADECSRAVVEKGSIGLEKLTEIFGNKILEKDGTLNRKALGQIVFSDSEQLSLLNSVMEPLIREEISRRLNQENNADLVVLDAPLLIEQHYDKICDFIMTIDVPKKIQLERLIERDKLSEDEAKSRIESQLSSRERNGFADVVIDSSGTVEQTRKQVIKWLKTINV
ncbi:dephospho-CoA kinase [Ligilactobacillus ruminis]|uniref:Dephospho-CoA kinase n=2 Tax=Ligilactobacillus ruminis TaxID=1623 RepID=A0AAQ2XIN8_9LACO|nr:dephospho-CoA kinase [Ligilactobacillus ruminis]KIC04530.1 dephospho-CoA kinase [Ligilactobacillus ruminis DPC 6832]KLA43663.1 dephospho-CoA kinase [Ligilactobacillus ruminis]NME31403.1 dephospho-CoA kinase [Ligilactobacillus ruminis]WDC81654.1 dephospho-CoA kinase [Ligilactobacillus ruminis]